MPVVIRAFDTVGKVESLVINLDAQMHRFAGGDRDRRRESVSLGRIRQAGHHAQVFADTFLPRDVEIVELRTVIVADQAGQMLEMLRFELDDGRFAEAMRLLPPRDQRLPEETANCLSAEKQ